MIIKELRELTNMTQKEFGEYLNIPLRTIQNWESEHRTPPDYVVELIEYKLKKESENMKKEITKKYYLIKHENVRGGKKRTEIEEKNVTDYFDEYLTLSDTYKGMDDFASEKDFFEWLETKYDELFKRLEGGENLDTGDHDLILE